MIPPARSVALSRVFSTLAVVLAVCSGAFAQEAARPDRGTGPNRSYAISDIENINLQNGNLNLTIPLASLPPIAGGKLSLSAIARYNSKLWDVLRFQNDAADLQWFPYVVDMPGTQGGWAIGGAGYSIYFRNANEDFDRLWYDENSGLPQWELDLLNDHQWWKVVLSMPDGSEHELRPTDNGLNSYSGSQDFLRGFYNVKPNGSPIRYYSLDGTYMFARISSMLDWTVYLPDGTKVTQTPDGVQRILDTNGNKIKMFTDTAGSHIQDEQTGREIKITYNPAANGGLGQYRVWYPTVSGIEHYIDINMGTTTVQGKTYPVNTWDEIGEMVCQRTEALSNTQLQVVREIIFPQTQPGQQQKYVFSYNSDTTENTSTNVSWSCYGNDNYTRTASVGWGELSRVVSPPGAIQTAAYVDYSYGLDSSDSLEISVDDLAYQSISQKKLYHDGVSDTWTYSISDVGSEVASPGGNSFSEQRYCAAFGQPNCSTDKAGLTYRSTRPFVRTEKHWTNLAFSGSDNLGPGGFYGPFNPVVDFEYTTLLDAVDNPLKMSAKALQYDYNGNVTQTKEYDWFDPALVSRDAQGVPTGVPASAPLVRTISHSHYNQAVGSTSSNVYAKRTVATGAPLILSAPKETTLGPSIVQLSYDGQAYGVAPTVGNPTSTKVWVDLDAKWITSSNTYGLYGNIATSTDARGKVTQFFYDDSTHALPTRVVVDPQNGTGTQTATTAFDYYTGLVTSQTDANGQVTTVDYTNQQLGAMDPYGRPGIIKSPVINIGGSNHRRRVTTTYLDATRQVIVASDLNAENDKLLKTRTTADMLGRPVLTEQTEDGTNYTISAINKYLDMGRVTLNSTAKRSTAASTDSWTRVTKDTAGRVVEVATFGGATQPAWTGIAGVYTGKVTTAYDANFTTVTDQAGKVRRSMVDALGRLRRVDEPSATNNLGLTASPVQPSSYTYDVFGNLTTVTQGSQTRTFTYDSLSRLRTAVNPESGSISYQYDDNGNLIVKTDARAVSAHYEYDSLDRVTRRWYNGSNSVLNSTHNVPALPSGVGATDEAKFYYDTQNLEILIPGSPPFNSGASKGRLTAVKYGTGSNGDYYAYDVLGRSPLKIQQTGAINYQISAVYTLSGAISSLTYPSGHTVTNTFDQAGRLTGLSGSLGDGTTRTYSSGILYSPVGGLVKEQFGTTTPIYNKLFYNSRGQLAEIRESTTYTGPTDYSADRGAIVNNYSTNCTGVCSGASMPDNNGNLLKQEIHIPSQTMRWQQYDYDSLNRLNWVREVLNGGAEQWKQQFTYDRWGNRTINTANTYGTGINNKAFTVNTANNRLGVPGGQPGTMSYDDAGNLTNDTYTGVGNRTYDGENKITSAWGGNNQAQLYAYDGSGQRIKRTVDGVQTWQVYGFAGELLAEYSDSGAAGSAEKEYGYRNGQLLVTATPGSSQSLSGNGTSAYMQAPSSSSVNIVGSITVEAWVKINAIGAYRVIISREAFQQSGTGGGYRLSITDTSRVRLDLFQTHNTYVSLSGATTITTGVWHHVAGVFDGSQMRVYLNGVLDGTMSTTSGPTSGTGNFHLGRFSYALNPYYFNGLIDEARVSNTALYTNNFTPQTNLTSSGSTKGLWKFDGQVTSDSSGNGNNGTLQGGAAYSSDIPPPPSTSYYSGSFNGTSAYMQAPSSSSVNIVGPITVEAWVKINAIGAYRAIISREAFQQSGTGGGYRLSITDTGKVRFDLFQTHNTYVNLSGATTITTGVWHHVAGVFDGTQMRIYLNGVLDGTMSTTSGPTTGTGNFHIGRFSYALNPYYFNGLIDEARVSNIALYSSNFTPQTHLTSSVSTKGLWTFDGQNTSDSSGNSNNLSLQGGAAYSDDVPGGGGGGGTGGGTPPQINWLVSDHLGTPRIVIDQTGSLVNIKRHDYLPFGEELFAPTGGRNAAMGYASGDGVRQQFTQYERDIETGLDFAQARYYASMQGRFTSTDPALDSMKAAIPQSWNRYSYVLNNPLVYIDPDGELWIRNDTPDGKDIPYLWVDKCSEGQTCYEAVAHNYGAGVRVYGSTDSKDIVDYAANANGMVDVRSLSQHHNAEYIVANGQAHPEEFLSTASARDLFNVAKSYSETFAGDEKLVFTAGSESNGKPAVGCKAPGVPCHAGHKGHDIDLRYMGSNGKPVQGNTAYQVADVNRTNWLIFNFGQKGLPNSYTGDESRFGRKDKSPKAIDKREYIHRHHLHVGL